MTWTVYLARKAYKQLGKLPQSIQDLADLAIADLEEQGFHPEGWDIRRIPFTADLPLSYAVSSDR